MAAEKLSAFELFQNLTAPLTWPMFALSYATFTYSINRHKSKDSKGPARPKMIEVEAIASGQAPAAVTVVWANYGIQSCFGTGMYAIEDGIKTWRVKFFVSNFQHWVAYRHAVAYGFVLGTTPPINKSGISAATDAQKGKWKAWAIPFKARTWDQKLNQAIGSILGVWSQYSKIVQAEPGIRKKQSPKKQSPKRHSRSTWDRLWK